MDATTSGVLEETPPFQDVCLTVRSLPGHSWPKRMGLLISICVWCVCVSYGIHPPLWEGIHFRDVSSLSIFFQGGIHLEVAMPLAKISARIYFMLNLLFAVT